MAVRKVKRPSYSIIADGIHVHPQAVAFAYNAHPDGCILVSDGTSHDHDQVRAGMEADWGCSDAYA